MKSSTRGFCCAPTTTRWCTGRNASPRSRRRALRRYRGKLDAGRPRTTGADRKRVGLTTRAREFFRRRRRRRRWWRQGNARATFFPADDFFFPLLAHRLFGFLFCFYPFYYVPAQHLSLNVTVRATTTTPARQTDRQR